MRRGKASVSFHYLFNGGSYGIGDIIGGHTVLSVAVFCYLAGYTMDVGSGHGSHFRFDSLSYQAGDDACQHIACAGGGKRGCSR